MRGDSGDIPPTFASTGATAAARSSRSNTALTFGLAGPAFGQPLLLRDIGRAATAHASGSRPNAAFAVHDSILRSVCCHSGAHLSTWRWRNRPSHILAP